MAEETFVDENALPGQTRDWSPLPADENHNANLADALGRIHENVTDIQADVPGYKEAVNVATAHKQGQSYEGPHAYYDKPGGGIGSLPGPGPADGGGFYPDEASAVAAREKLLSKYGLEDSPQEFAQIATAYGLDGDYSGGTDTFAAEQNIGSPVNSASESYQGGGIPEDMRIKAATQAISDQQRREEGE